MKVNSVFRYFLLFLLMGLSRGVWADDSTRQVVLIRHAAVDLEHHGWMSAKKAAALRAEYDRAPVFRFEPDTVLAYLPMRLTDTVYVSALPRSIATGLFLFGDSAHIVSSRLLNEFELHVVRLPLVLPYKGWTSISRALWLLGARNSGTESYREAKERVRYITDYIEEKAKQNGQVILVTHGFLNRNIAHELRKRGWQLSQNRGKENLGATILEKNISSR